jgi:PAS domain S-box-containing protein
MQKPEIPANESDRQAALDRYKILDTLPEQVYDDLTQLAADICGTPIALISLVDKDRQWFKSRVGVDVSETPREISFCGHTVAANAILNVPNASLDPRFADNPLVAKDPSIRFYVGVPLITEDNFALGTLCVIDRQPRDLTEQQIRQLEALSRLAISQLELRLKKESLRILASVVESSDDAIMTKTLEGIITSWNPAAEKLFGYSEAEAIGQPIFMLIPSDHLDEEFRILARIRRGERLEHFETVRISKEGKSIEVSATISPLVNDAGQVVGASTILRDISDRKQTENTLRESQALLQTVLDAFPLSIFWKDRQSILLGCNRLFAITSGMKSPLEAIGKSNFDFSYTNNEALGYLADDQQVMESGLAKLNIEETITLPSGEQQWIQTNKIPLRDSEGNVIGVMGTFQDISERKQVEKALKESEHSYASLMAAAPVGIFRTDAMGHCTYVNDHWCRISGLTLESALGDGWRQGLYSEDRQSISDEWYRSAQEDRPFSLEYRFQRPDGVITWVYGQSVVKLDADGIITGYVGTITDINDRKQAELQLQKVSDRLALALSSGAIGCWEWNIQQNMAFWDERMYELYGVCKEKDLRIVYEIWAGAIHPEDRAESEMTTQQIATGQVEEYDTEFRVVHPDGSIHFIKAYGTLKRDASGNPLSIIGINFDISDRKQAEAQLQKINDELLRATRLKDEFLANMSHELRTPLNSILGMNEVLQDEIFGSINERQLKTLQTIENSSTHLLALINDILDVAKIESGEVMLELTATDLDSLCQSSLAFIKQQALTKRIQLIPRIPKHLPEIMLDERRIRQVLINLLNNAVKFTLEGGTITLEVSQVQLESSTTNLTTLNYLKIAVIDTGIGISAENIQKLFQPFIQIDSALNRQYQGTGLGLALVKRLVELHGGNVELTSEVGVGSCFAINLLINIGSPAIEEQTEDLSEQSQIGQSQTEELILPLILLAEDNEANITTFSSYLDAKGYRILLATNGQQAIDLAKSHSPDLILMDIQMPVMDGMEAIKQIRLDPNLVDIPIVALTALAMAGDRERCLAVGANEYLTKPVKLKQLATSIQQFLMQRKNNV